MSADICCQYELQSKTTMANRLFLVPSIYTEYQNNKEKWLKALSVQMKMKPKLLRGRIVEKCDARVAPNQRYLLI